MTDLWTILGAILCGAVVVVVYILVLFPEAIMLDLAGWFFFSREEKMKSEIVLDC